MSQYAEVAQDALKTITEAGALATFTEVGDADPTTVDYDPLTDTFDVPNGTSFSAPAVKIRSDPQRFQTLGLVIASPITLLVAAKACPKEPEPGMRVSFGAYNAVIRSVTSVAPIGKVDPILYTVDGEL